MQTVKTFLVSYTCSKEEAYGGRFMPMLKEMEEREYKGLRREVVIINNQVYDLTCYVSKPPKKQHPRL